MPTRKDRPDAQSDLEEVERYAGAREGTLCGTGFMRVSDPGVTGPAMSAFVLLLYGSDQRKDPYQRCWEEDRPDEGARSDVWAT
jgi:hypothetical protein